MGRAGHGIMVSTNNFDLIRLVAAAQVMLYHGAEHVLPRDLHWIKAAIAWFPGLPIFFFVSGYLVSASYERATSIRRFALNRVLRIFPALWVALVVSCVCILALGFPLSTAPGTADVMGWWAAQMTFLQFYNPEWLRGFGVGVVNGSLWTIPVELQFYVVLPFIYAVCRRYANVDSALVLTALLALAMSLVSAGFRSSYHGSFMAKLTVVSVAPYLYMFMIGLLLQRGAQRIQRWIHGKALSWLVAYLLACALASMAGVRVGTNEPFAPLAILLGILTVSAAYTWPDLSSRLLRGHDVSYGVYVYHMLVFNTLLAAGLARSALTFAIGIGLTVAAAIASWLLVERRFLAAKVRAASVRVPQLAATA